MAFIVVFVLIATVFLLPKFAVWSIVGIVLVAAFVVATIQGKKDTQKSEAVKQSAGSKYDQVSPEIPSDQAQAHTVDPYPQPAPEKSSAVVIERVPDISPEYRSFLFEWQQELRFGHPNTHDININDPMRKELLFNESQLRDWSLNHLQDANRTMNDCLELIQSTSNPDVFFMRLDLLEAHARHLERLEKFTRLPANISQEILRDISSIRQDATSAFLKRSFYYVTTKAQSLKTEKGKLNRYRKHYEALQEYRHCMSAENNTLLNDIYCGYVGENAASIDEFVSSDNSSESTSE